MLPFDHLVLALGNVTAFGGMPGLQQHALPFKTLGDALHIRNHVLQLLEEAANEPDDAVRRGLTTFVVAGGGFSGVEVAAELNDFVREIVRDYPGIAPEDLRVVLIHSGERILPELDGRLGTFAERVLTKRGVEIKLKSRLASATATAAVLRSGERIETRTLVSTVPAGPNPPGRKISTDTRCIGACRLEGMSPLSRVHSGGPRSPRIMVSRIPLASSI